MNNFHRWFHSGPYTLASHIHIPEKMHGNTAALIVPPFGWEDICSYRSLRAMSETLLANGIPSMRFDLPAAGDSSGSPRDTNLVNAWIQSIGDAAAELRAITGLPKIAVIGIRLGAMLAAAAAARGEGLNDLILWGPAASGRSLLRELRAFQQMESSAGESAPDSTPAPAGLEVAGFLLSPETERDVEALELSRCSFGGSSRILILTRDSFPVDRKLVLAFENSGCAVEVSTGEGYAAMMLEPHDAVPPLATFTTILDFLKRDSRGDGKTEISEPDREPLFQEAGIHSSAATIETATGGVIETMLPIESLCGTGFGIIAEPAKGSTPADTCLLFLNPGAVRHIGPNRMWVEIARKWAARGVPSLRMDFHGIGEADGQPASEVGGLYQSTAIEQIGAAIDVMRSRTRIMQFAVIGLCSGAFWGFHSLVNFAEIRSGILLNPRLFFWDPNIDRRRILRRTVNGFTSSKTWSRLARGKITTKRIKQGVRAMVHKFSANGDEQLQISPAEMSRALTAIQRNKSKFTLIFTEGEPLLREMEEEFWLPSKAHSLHCVRVPGGGHTFRPLWAQSMIHELVDGELGSLLTQRPGKKHVIHNSKAKASSLT
ncbi:MAG TPA: hypothetical protein VN633_20765 [Bryobacteraceae bacterium]|nr:hypothetical protein [Bryobacteraceae bacterium]